MNPGFHCTGQMADSLYGIVSVSGLLMSMLWIEWPMLAVGIWYHVILREPPTHLGRRKCWLLNDGSTHKSTFVQGVVYL